MPVPKWWVEPTGTFLQFVCRKLLGQPVRRGQPGESYYRCPFHADSNPSFHTLPERAGTRDRWKCFGCGAWGDEADLLRGLRHLGDRRCMGGWADHEALLAEWRQEWERSAPRS